MISRFHRSLQRFPHWATTFILLPFLMACSDGRKQEESQGINELIGLENDSPAYTPTLSDPSINRTGTDSFPTRKIISNVPLRGNPSLQVALYLPVVHDGEAAIPLLLCLDAHARGEMVLEKYKTLADKHGFALAVSQSSRNGLQPRQSIDIANGTLIDLKERLNIDPQRIYLGGFSGGARVACLTAQERGDIAGVIGCAAGYQPNMDGQSFSYYGIVGLEDFNYLEFKGLDRLLESLSPPYRIVTWNGGHEWPPLDNMSEAWAWMEFRAMAYEVMPRDKDRIEDLQNAFQREIDRCKGTDCYELRKDLHSYLRELIDVEPIKAEMRKLAGEKSYQDERTRGMEMEAKEIELREICKHDIAVKDLAHWQKEVPRLERAGKPNTEEGWMHRRVLGFMSLVAFSYSNQYLGANDFGNAEKFISIYELVDPPNNEHAYLKAKLMMRQLRTPEALASLQHAVDLGFKDEERLRLDPDFSILANDPGFIQILNDLEPD